MLWIPWVASRFLGTCATIWVGDWDTMLSDVPPVQMTSEPSQQTRPSKIKPLLLLVSVMLKPFCVAMAVEGEMELRTACPNAEAAGRQRKARSVRRRRTIGYPG